MNDIRVIKNGYLYYVDRSMETEEKQLNDGEWAVWSCKHNKYTEKQTTHFVVSFHKTPGMAHMALIKISDAEEKE